MYQNTIKPVLDFICAVVILVLLLPVLLLGLIASTFACKSNPVFKHERPGYRAKPIKIYKLRTMLPGVDSTGQILSNNERITPIGNVLRRFSIDEIPQLINVLRGELSLVGPRPLQMWYLAHYTDRQNLRHSVKPGITGLAQISGRNKLSWEDKFELDVQYVEQMSLLLDLKILLGTALKVFDVTDVSASPNNTMDAFVERPENYVDRPDGQL